MTYADAAVDGQPADRSRATARGADVVLASGSGAAAFAGALRPLGMPVELAMGSRMSDAAAGWLRELRDAD